MRAQHTGPCTSGPDAATSPAVKSRLVKRRQSFDDTNLDACPRKLECGQKAHGASPDHDDSILFAHFLSFQRLDAMRLDARQRNLDLRRDISMWKFKVVSRQGQNGRTVFRFLHFHSLYEESRPQGAPPAGALAWDKGRREKRRHMDRNRPMGTSVPAPLGQGAAIAAAQILGVVQCVLQQARA